jgi:hypothetical protein
MKVLRQTTNQPGCLTLSTAAGYQIRKGSTLEYVEFMHNPKNIENVLVSGIKILGSTGLKTFGECPIDTVGPGKLRSGKWRRVVVDLSPMEGQVLTATSLCVGLHLQALTFYPQTVDIFEVLLTRYRQTEKVLWRYGSNVTPVGGVVSEHEYDEYPIKCEEIGSTESPIDDLELDRSIAGNARGRAYFEIEKHSWSIKHSALTRCQVLDFMAFYWTHRAEPFLYRHLDDEQARLVIFSEKPVYQELQASELFYYLEVKLEEV